MQPGSRRENGAEQIGRLDGRTFPLVLILDPGGAFLPDLGSREQIRLGYAELSWLAFHFGHEGAAASEPGGVDPEKLDRIRRVIARRSGRDPTHPRTDAVLPAASVTARPRTYEGDHRMATPTPLAVSDQGFDFLDHWGALRLRLTAEELVAAIGFVTPNDVATVAARQAEALGAAALGPEQFVHLVDRLASAELTASLEHDALHAAEGRVAREFRRGIALQKRRVDAVRVSLDHHHAAEVEREAATGVTRVKVVPVNSDTYPLLSLGLLMAHAEAYDDGRLAAHYQFLPDWADHTVPGLRPDTPPAVYLFSNYLWSHAWNVGRSAEVKAHNPRNITVHGGPNTPKYDDDIKQFFRTNPQVDITVHGEGEATFVHLLDVLKESLAAGEPDLSLLHEVDGISFRLGDEVIHTAKRDRIADLDTIPSPYDTGLFDSIGDNEIPVMPVETNRGCPYGCTFCDWGSATLSRIRQFDLDRVFRELEWCARHKVATIFNADANFGIFARDVEIARKLVQLKRQYGYPKVFESNYAKNTVKHLRQIIEILADGDIVTTGTLSLQSVDPGTLAAVHRSNIRVEKYEDLAVEFNKRGLPLAIELMMGLPGSTMASYLGDLQQCVDREVKARVYPTEVLMNSPMNDPDYRAEHQISTLRPVNQDWSEDDRTRKKALVVSTTSFSREEYDQMERIRLAFLFFENFAVGRHISRFVRQETGLREIDLYARLVDETRADPNRWPAIAFVVEVIVEYMIPPASWSLFTDELHDFLVTCLGMADDTSLRTALRTQLALIPSRERAFPEIIELEHDYPAWHAAVLAAKQDDPGGWTEVVPRLATFGPTTFTVADPQSVALLGLGMALEYDSFCDWELDSPMARPMRFLNRLRV